MDIGKARCPHCKNEVRSLNIEVTTLFDEQMGSWRGLLYSCPVCDCVLSAGFDPVALETDLVNKIVAAVRGR